MVADQLSAVGVVRYRALQTNLASLAIATSLGFVGEAKTSLYDSRRRELPSTRSTTGPNKSRPYCRPLRLRGLNFVLDGHARTAVTSQAPSRLEELDNHHRYQAG